MHSAPPPKAEASAALMDPTASQVTHGSLSSLLLLLIRTLDTVLDILFELEERLQIQRVDVDLHLRRIALVDRSLT
jgi:hypothetical protein